MIINQKILENGITPAILEKLIQRHEMRNRKYGMLREYYRGKQNILSRAKGDSVANNKIVANHAKYITQMSVAYFMGGPVTYSVSENYDIEDIKNVYFEQDIEAMDSRLAKEASICGKAIEMVYANGEAMPRSCLLPVESAFVVYDDTVEHHKLLGVHYYHEICLDGTPGDYVALCADENIIRKFRGGKSLTGFRLKEEIPHYFGGVPFVEFLNNEEEQGDYEQEISLIDAYNTLMSDRLNDKEQFVDSFLLLLGIDVTSDQAKELKKEKILCGEIGGQAEYLNKVLNEADTEVLRAAIKEDIHKLSMVPDLSDEEFAGNLSGIALKYKLLGFEQSMRNKEILFRKGLRERMGLYMNFLHIKRNTPIVPLHRIDVEFHRNLPANELEIAQMVSTLAGQVSDETLLARIPFITDAKEEKEILLKEQEQKQRVMLSRMGNYDEPIKTGDAGEE